jgi:photoactive yellow protein
MARELELRVEERAAEAARGSDLVQDGLRERIAALDADERDALPFGCVGLDDEGRVTAYNAWESALSGLAETDVLGRHFFTEVAPCTNNALFRGLFERGVANGALDHFLPYTFTLRMRPTHVVVHFFRHAPSGTNWLFVRRAGA